VQRTVNTPENAAFELAGANESIVMNTLVVGNKVVGTEIIANCLFSKAPKGSANLHDNTTTPLCGGQASDGFTYSSIINLSTNLDYNQSLWSYVKGYMLGENSAAIDTGATNYTYSGTGVKYYCPGSDYRWAIRPMKGKDGLGGCDVGAYEANNYVTGLPEFYPRIAFPLIFK
jgi:hypothetical protein